MSPVLQVILPLPGRAPLMVRLSMKLMTQVPVAVLAGFGTASGAPNRQPGLVQWRSPKLGVVGQVPMFAPVQQGAGLVGPRQPALPLAAGQLPAVGTSVSAAALRSGSPAVHAATLL